MQNFGYYRVALRWRVINDIKCNEQICCHYGLPYGFIWILVCDLLRRNYARQPNTKCDTKFQWIRIERAIPRRRSMYIYGIRKTEDLCCTCLLDALFFTRCTTSGKIHSVHQMFNVVLFVVYIFFLFRDEMMRTPVKKACVPLHLMHGLLFSFYKRSE